MSESKINDGGPAFPNTFVDKSTSGINHTVVVDGMSLRDWFAGKALQGMLAQSSSPLLAETRSPSDEWAKCYSEDCSLHKHLAKLSYIYADDMLAARNKHE